MLLQSSRLEAAFKVYDKNGDGQLNLDEIKAIFADDLDIPDEEWRQLIQEVDRDQNGLVCCSYRIPANFTLAFMQISYTEFRDMMTNYIDNCQEIEPKRSEEAQKLLKEKIEKKLPKKLI